MFRHFVAAVDKYANENKYHKHSVRLLRQLILLILDRSKQSTITFMKMFHSLTFWVQMIIYVILRIWYHSKGNCLKIKVINIE